MGVQDFGGLARAMFGVQKNLMLAIDNASVDPLYLNPSKAVEVDEGGRGGKGSTGEKKKQPL